MVTLLPLGLGALRRFPLFGGFEHDLVSTYASVTLLRLLRKRLTETKLFPLCGFDQTQTSVEVTINQK